MLQKDLVAPIDETPEIVDLVDKILPPVVRSPRRARVGFALCTLGLVLSVLLTVTPLTRLLDRVVHLQIALGSLLTNAGSWLPLNFGLVKSPTDAPGRTAYIELFLLLGLVAFCYGIGAWLVQRRTSERDQRVFRSFIWAGAIIAGLIYVFTPAMLSHDILAYIGYGRVFAIYHANPYFTPIAHFPHDPFTASNFWANTVSLYGPIWIDICWLCSRFVVPTLAAYTLAFRLLALVFFLLNTWLVGRILQQMGRAPRTVTLGMLLYAWNPLILLESGLGGHNDVLMMSFVLLAVLLLVRAERREWLLHPHGYLPPVVVLALAVLVKFVVLPVLAACLIFLLCKTLRPTVGKARLSRQARYNWRAALSLLGQTSLALSLVALSMYGPFWFGHSVTNILAAFRYAPTALYADNSLMHSAQLWPFQQFAATFPLTLLTSHAFWDMLALLGGALCLLLGAGRLWSNPTTKNFVLVALSAFMPLLLTTPWFFAWYVTWIVSLAVICLPVRHSRVQGALLAFTLTFSFSALLTYLFTNHEPFFYAWDYLVGVLTTLPPTCAFLFALVLWQPARYSIRGDTRHAQTMVCSASPAPVGAHASAAGSAHLTEYPA